jgi:hypothetical protein
LGLDEDHLAAKLDQNPRLRMLDLKNTGASICRRLDPANEGATFPQVVLELTLELDLVPERQLEAEHHTLGSHPFGERQPRT